MTTHVQPTDAIRSSLVATQAAAAERLVQRANLRSYTSCLLRELNERHDHAVGTEARAVLEARVQELTDQLLAALRGDVAAIEALCVKSRDPMPQ